jgi:iduronate 2-sulfatase
MVQSPNRGRMIRRLALRSSLLGLLAAAIAQAAPAKPNVLFIVVDDLRPELACYGASYIHSPNIDKLAAGGVLFSRAYCQQAVCSPSRTSLLTGLRPDSTRVYDLVTHFRKNVPNAVTLPEYFKKQGYYTQGLSKVFHNGLDDPQSWSVPHWEPQARTYHNAASLAAMQEAQRKLDEQAKQAKDKTGGAGLQAGPAHRAAPEARGPAWEASEASDSDLADGKTADKAIEVLRQIKDKPFFFAVGFYKPHLPFVAPKKYFDLYPLDQIRLADNPNPPEDVPPIAMHDSAELRRYCDIPRKGPVPILFGTQRASA